MKKLKHKNMVSLLFLVLLIIGAFATGCGSKTQSSAASAKATTDTQVTEDAQTTDPATTEDTAAKTEEVKKIVIGTGNAFKPYCYLDENGKLAGYELQVLTAVDELLPQYEFEYQTFDFPNILVSLDAKKIDIGAHQFELNEERKAKYLFGDESYTTFILRITVDKNRDDIETIDDLQGKNVRVSTGSNDAYILEQYNKEHADKPINLIYSSETSEQLINNVTNGTYDAFISITRIVDSYNKEFGDKLKTVGEPIASSSTYYVYNKEEEQLKADIDGALKELKSNGKLAAISTEVLGGDYTTND